MNQEKWNITCVIYDCDGVLFDSLDANSRLYNHIAASVGRPPLSDGEIRYCHTHTVYESIHHIFREDPGQEKKALDFLKHQMNLGDFVVHLRMEPNLLPTLDRLKEKGIMRAISTNRTTSMKALMEYFALGPYFEMVVTALDVERPKPDPESVEKILATLGVEKGQTLFVGDSDVDRETAAGAGVKFVAYKNRDLPADAFIEDHLTLLSFLANGRPPRP